MSITNKQKDMLLLAGKTNSSRVYAADFDPSMRGQSAFHRTCAALVRQRLMEQSRYQNQALMNAYELTPLGRQAVEDLKAKKAKPS